MIKFDDFEGKLVKRGLDLNYPVALSAVILNGYLGEMNKKNMSLDYDATEYLFNDIFSRLFWLLEQRSTASSCDVSVPEALAAFMGYVRVLSCAQLDYFGMDVPEASGKPIIYNGVFPDRKINWSSIK